jgi:glucan phosphoethanolaminetransferase (alkaline phosphatase superfamily)
MVVSDSLFFRERDAIGEARKLRVQVLNTSLLIAVVVGGLAFARTLTDAIDLHAWRIVVIDVVMYAGFITLLLARRLPYPVRALGFLGLLYLVGAMAFLAVGYLAAPALLLAGQSVLACVLFGRRVTMVTLGLNLVTLLAVGALLSSGFAHVETTTFYDPSVFANWVRVTAIFAVFASIAVVSVDVLMRHLNQSLRDQAELIENLRGALQLRDEAERQRRELESKLRKQQGQNERRPSGTDDTSHRA